MICRLIKKNRGYGRLSRTWYMRYKYDWMPNSKDLNLGVTDKQVAGTKMRQIMKEIEEEHFGHIAPKAIRQAAKEPISVHLEAFLKDMATLGRSRKYVYFLKRYVTAIADACKWTYLQDINADQFTEWRSGTDYCGKTRNEYRAGMNVFLTWLIEHKRISDNPLKAVKKVDTRRQQENKRKSLTHEQFAKLLETLPNIKLKAAHLLAVYTGVRRGEMEKLEWADFILDGDAPYVKLRASITKNSLFEVRPLRPEVVEALRQLPKLTHKPEKVFSWLPKFTQLRKYWIEAGIPASINNGYDFHSLRVTFCTWMQYAGVPQRVAQQAMRHSDPSLTAKIYTDTSLCHGAG